MLKPENVHFRYKATGAEVIMESRYAKILTIAGQGEIFDRPKNKGGRPKKNKVLVPEKPCDESVPAPVIHGTTIVKPFTQSNTYQTKSITKA